MKIWCLAILVILSSKSFAQQVSPCSCSETMCIMAGQQPLPQQECTPNGNSRTCYFKISGNLVPVACSVPNTPNTRNGAQASSEKDMTNENKSNSYGGAYNTANVTTTDTINGAIKVSGTALQQLGTGMTNNVGARSQANLQTTGTAQSAAQGTADTLNAAAKAQTMVGMVNLGASMTQLYRANAHRASAAGLDAKTAAAIRQNNQDRDDLKSLECGSLILAAKSTCEEPINVHYAQVEQNIITVNSTKEKTVQSETAMTEAITAAGTGVAAMSALQQAAQERAQAKIALQFAGSGFAFNPGNGSGYTDGGSAAPPTGDMGGVVAANTDTGALPSNTQLNPNLDTGGPNAPNGRLGEGGPAGGAPPSGGGGVASAAGTSPGKDDAANKDNTPPGKSSAGSYGDANGGPSGFSRAPGGPSVGMDNSFADMLKKFLPGEENGKKNGDLNYNDRMPASDAAAVIARNKNIFEEVSKRYKKKSSDGEIVF